MSLETVDFFLERERLTWKQFLASSKNEDLDAWRRALRALQGELEDRVRMLQRGFISSGVRMSGLGARDAE